MPDWHDYALRGRSIASFKQVENTLTNLIIPNLQEDVKRGLQARADRHRRSLEEEVREILTPAAWAENMACGEGLGTRIARRFAGIGLTEDIPELHWAARPPRFR